MRRIALAAIIFLVAVGPVAAAKETAGSILARVRAQMAGVNDYSASASMSVDSPTMHVKESRFKVYYKKPDKLHIEPEGGFAIVPKGTYLGNPLEEITKDNTAKLVGEAKLDGKACWLIRLTPKEQNPNNVEFTVWVEKARSLIIQSRAEPSKDSRMEVKWTYTKVEGKYWLPSRIDFVISGLPAEIARERGPFVQTSGKATGKAVIKFSDYKVNRGVSDSMFHRGEKR